jgi:hypothetical protein
VEGTHCDVIERYGGIYLQTAKNHEKPLRITSIIRHHAIAIKSLPLRSPVTYPQSSKQIRFAPVMCLLIAAPLPAHRP